MTTMTLEEPAVIMPDLTVEPPTADETPVVKVPKPYRIDLMDSIEWLATLADDSVDLVLTDPAYESLEKWRNIGTTTRLGGAKRHEAGYDQNDDWFHIFANSRFPKLLEGFFRVMKPTSHLYLHADEETRDIIKPMMQSAGFTVHKSLIWDKMAIGMGYHWRARYEFIIFASKGKKSKPLNDLGMSDVFDIKRLKGPQYYPTQKPLMLAGKIVHNASAPGDVVIDPFCGSGTTGVASVALGRKFYGCDIEPKAVERSRVRNKAANIHRKSIGRPVVSEELPGKGGMVRLVSRLPSLEEVTVKDGIEHAVTIPPFIEEVQGKGPDRETAEENLLENYRLGLLGMLGE